MRKYFLKYYSIGASLAIVFLIFTSLISVNNSSFFNLNNIIPLVDLEKTTYSKGEIVKGKIKYIIHPDSIDIDIKHSLSTGIDSIYQLSNIWNITSYSMASIPYKHYKPYQIELSVLGESFKIQDSILFEHQNLPILMDPKITTYIGAENIISLDLYNIEVSKLHIIANNSDTLKINGDLSNSNSCEFTFYPKNEKNIIQFYYDEKLIKESKLISLKIPLPHITIEHGNRELQRNLNQLPKHLTLKINPNQSFRAFLPRAARYKINNFDFSLLNDMKDTIYTSKLHQEEILRIPEEYNTNTKELIIHIQDIMQKSQDGNVSILTFDQTEKFLISK